MGIYELTTFLFKMMILIHKETFALRRFFPDAPGPGSAPDGLTHSHFLVRTDAICS